MSVLSEWLQALQDDVDNCIDNRYWDVSHPEVEYYQIMEIKAELIRAWRKIEKLKKRINK